jgi:ACS family hexuronate transporter-like MFS transporter
VGGIRWTICALLFAAITINYRDRQILGILAPVLEREIGWSEVQYGSYWILFLIAASAYLVALGIIQLLTPALKPAQMDDLN